MKLPEKNSKILVVGLGKRTGLTSCNYLTRKGYKVFATDTKKESELQDVLNELDSSVKVFAGNQNPEILNENFDLIVLSPGVPKSIPLISSAVSKGIRVISEIELGYLFSKGSIIGITGTDGKTTTTSLTGHLLKDLGIHTLVGGNIGTPYISFADETRDDSVTVLELSSFQLETIDSFRPDASAILNITPDHLDRYNDIDEYADVKFRININQQNDDYFIYNKDDARLSANTGRIKGKLLSFSLSDKTANAYYENGKIYLRWSGAVREILETAKLKIEGVHNVANTMTAILLVLSVFEKRNAEVDFDLIRESCCSFKGLPHRMEVIGIHKGRKFINDSKATTVGALEMALKSIPDGSVLILGGRTKGDDYSRLAVSLKKKVKQLVLIGETSDEFSGLFRDVPNIKAKDMEEAVNISIKYSSNGDTVILSPACASFDMFKNYEERGESFRQVVLSLKD